MKNFIVDFVPLGFLALALFGIKPVRPFSSLDKNYLSIERSKNLRGLLAIAVVLHHLSLNTDAGIIYPVFKSVGFYSVCIFFFLSGYGLQKSHISSKDYRKNFIAKRLPSVLIPYLIVNLIFLITHSIFGEHYNLSAFLDSFKTGMTINTVTWYLICLVMFYIVFWLLMITLKESYIGIIIGSFVWYTIYLAYCIHSGYGKWWYNASLVFVFGLFWATFETQILSILEKKYLILCIISFILFGVAFLGDQINFKNLGIIFEIISGPLFTICVLLILMKFQIGNTLTRKFGVISLEIYLMQKLPMYVFKQFNLFKTYPLISNLLAVAICILLGYLLHIVLVPIFRVIKKKK